MYRKMEHKFILFCCGAMLALCLPGAQAQTIEECQQAAERNYPLIRQYRLIEQTTELTLDNLQKGWLPQVSAKAQATLQSDVPSWPGQMQTMLQQMGLNMKGLSRDQYRVGVDVQQTVYDGGLIRSQKQIAREQGKVEAAQTEVSIYQLRRRVSEMYFAALLLDEQMRLNRDMRQLLESSENKLASMFKHGTAAESDWLNVKAERLKVEQQLTDLEAQRTTLLRLLSVFCGIEVKTPSLPIPESAGWSATSLRPELRAIDAQLRLTDAQEQALDARLRPRAGVFLQGFYGYPGYNMFDDMLRHRWSLGGMVGLNVSWNIGALYTRKNDKARLSAQRESLGVQRDVFLFNNSLEQMQHDDDIARYNNLLSADEQIVKLRQSVRKAAESKLQHGIIDVNDLIREINNENAARVQQSIHGIQKLKAVYDNKFTTNK